MNRRGSTLCPAHTLTRGIPSRSATTQPMTAKVSWNDQRRGSEATSSQISPANQPAKLTSRHGIGIDSSSASSIDRPANRSTNVPPARSTSRLELTAGEDVDRIAQCGKPGDNRLQPTKVGRVGHAEDDDGARHNRL